MGRSDQNNIGSTTCVKGDQCVAWRRGIVFLFDDVQLLLPSLTVYSFVDAAKGVNEGIFVLSLFVERGLTEMTQEQCLHQF